MLEIQKKGINTGIRLPALSCIFVVNTASLVTVLNNVRGKRVYYEVHTYKLSHALKVTALWQSLCSFSVQFSFSLYWSLYNFHWRRASSRLQLSQRLSCACSSSSPESSQSLVVHARPLLPQKSVRTRAAPTVLWLISPAGHRLGCTARGSASPPDLRAGRDRISN